MSDNVPFTHCVIPSECHNFPEPVLNLDEDMGLNSVNLQGNQALRPNPGLIRDLNREFERLLSLICGSIEEFSLYDTSKIAVSISRSRRSGKAGTLAYVVPLRYVGGAKERKGRRWGIAGFYSYASEQLDREQPGALYIMTFLVPKFFSLKPRDRLETMVHELYHLHPTLRGDLRRFAGANTYHGPTPAQYDRKVKSLCAEALSVLPTLEHHPLLALGEDEIGRCKAKRFNIPRHVFRHKPFALFLSIFIFLTMLVATAAHAAQVPVVIIKDGEMRVAPEKTAGTEITIKRGDHFDAYRLSEDHQWVWMGNNSVQGWVHRSFIQSQNLDKRLGLRDAFVDTKVPNKLGEKKEGDVDEKDDEVEDSKALKARAPKVVKPSVTEVDAQDDTPSAEVSSTDVIASAGAEAVPVVGATGELDMRGDLEEKPNAEQLKDLKMSPQASEVDEDGERVSKAQIKAQTRLSPLKKNDFQFKNDNGTAADPDGGVVTWEDSYDTERDRSNIILEGKLFEKPSETARRYGILEKGDEVLPLAHTEDGKWVRIRLQETGEEGWYPALSVRVSQGQRQVLEIHQNAIEAYGAWGSRGYSFGFGTGYFYGFAYDDNNRYWSVGANFDYWLGQRLTYQSSTYSSRYLGFELVGRYNMPSQSSTFTGVVEGGMGYYKANIKTGGISEDTLVLNGISSSSATKISPLLGVGVKFGFTKHFDAIALVRVRLSSATMVNTFLGIGGNF